MNKKKKVVVLNGPPGCGKDTTSLFIHRRMWRTARSLPDQLEHLPARMNFKDHLFLVTALTFGVSHKKLISDNQNRRDLKDAPYFTHPKDGRVMTLREGLIHVSEDLIKPVFGRDYFGKKAGNAAAIALWHYGSVVFADGGFPDEFVGMVDRLPIGTEVHVVRLRRDGCTFEGDSRAYLTEEILLETGGYAAQAERLNIFFHDVENNGEPGDPAAHITTHILNGEQWNR